MSDNTYGCITCGEWFPNIARLHDHNKREHPGKLKTTRATPEQMRVGLGAMDDLRAAMGMPRKHGEV